MDNDRESERKSDVQTEIPLVEVKSPDKTSVSDDTLVDKCGIDSSNRVLSGGFFDTEGISTTNRFEETRVSSDPVKEVLENKVESAVQENLQSSSGNVVFDVVHVETDKTGSEEARVSSEIDSIDIDRNLESRVFEEVHSKEMDIKMESRVSREIDREMKLRVSSEVDTLEMESDVSEIKVKEVRGKGCAVGDHESGQLIGTVGEGAKRSPEETKTDVEMMEKPTVSDFNFSYSMVDEGYAARMSEAFGSEAAKALSYGFEPGDMVWGKVKSHPWWPGQIFNEAFASSSVRRSKREGHVLVAFFGDSSYGWFDPAELIPFDPHYSEKSKQMNSRVFMKAVEEAVDEAHRRAALGLTCYCRNPFNFRPTNAKGYYAVDVGGFEPGGIYSVKQIKKARYDFQPGDALSFVQQLAMNPRDNEQKGIGWSKNVSMFLALRKATFEEFDETYAQAFGMPASRPDPDAKAGLDKAGKVPSRAPLSGPLVMAEALGEMKSSSKPSKVKEQSKKDKYVLKRREKPNESKVHKFSSHTGIATASYEGGQAVLASGDYIFQKRTSAVSVKPQTSVEQQRIQAFSKGDAVLTPGGQESTTLDGKLVSGKFSSADAQIGMTRVDLPVAYGSSSSSQKHPEDGNKDMSVLCEMNGRGSPIEDVGPTSMSFDQNFLQESKGIDFKQESAKSSPMSDGIEQSKQPINDRCGPDGVWGFGDRVLGTTPVVVVKKAKVKNLEKSLNSEKTGTAEKKNKKKRKLGSEASSDHPHKLVKTVKEGKLVKKSAGKSIGNGLVTGENSQLVGQRKNGGAVPGSIMVLSKDDLSNVKVELPQLVDDLLGLALDPFHGVERNSPAIVQHVLLQFRSLVYQKSLVPVSASEAENSELSENKSSASAKIPSSSENAKESMLKLPKPLARPDDPTKSGRKRSLSDRQEEKSVKRLKKVNELKALTSEKKAALKISEPPKQGERKEASITSQPKLTKPDTAVRKPEPPLLSRAVEPAMLVLKFPPRTTLPSVPELKARFARFGPLDHSALRVFWKSSTCRVVFKNKSHASAAYNYAIRNKALFGQVKVNYQLRDVGAPTEVPTESANKRQALLDDNTSDEVPSFRLGADSDSLGELRRTGLTQQRSQQSGVQLKSCLKKPLLEEAASAMDGGGGGGARENRVRFKLGGDETGSSSVSCKREEMIMGSNNNYYKNNNGGNEDGVGVGGLSLSSSSSSSLAMDINRKNIQKVILPQLQPPLLPLNSQQQQQQHSSSSSSNLHVDEFLGHFAKSTTPYIYHHHHYNQMEELKNNNNTLNSINTSKTDISSQMLSLMKRCNDIVMDVTSSFGYVPYHTL